MADTPDNSRVDRQIFSLALPALGTLIAEPLLTTADAAMIGHVGTAELGGLTIGLAIINLLVGLCIFIAYSTTSTTGKYMGQHNRTAALTYGIQGMWLAAVIGVILATGLWLLAPIGASLMGASDLVLPYAVTYLHWSAPGLMFMLIVLGANGAFRGLLNTTTPFIISLVGTLVNIPLNATFIYGCHMSVAGAGLGTSISQFGMALTLIIIISREAKRHDATMRPQPRKIIESGLSGLPLVIRSVSLQLTVMTTVRVMAAMGTAELAAYKAVDQLYVISTFIMDSLAIAAQALIANAIGNADKARVRAVMARCVRWGVIVGAGLTGILIVVSPVAGWLFTSDRAVLDIVWVGYLAVASWLPLAGAVFMYDGILIGAGDTKYLAVAQTATLAYIPILLAVSHYIPAGRAGLAIVWLMFGFVLMTLRFATLYFRARTDVWIDRAIAKQ